MYLVFEYLEHDMHGIIDSHVKFEKHHIKCIMKQLLDGMTYLHDTAGVLHRDIKGGNLLMSKGGVLKIADFGLSRTYFKGRNDIAYTQKVVTLWYRAPELLLGMKNYSTAVDIWSVG